MPIIDAPKSFDPVWSYFGFKSEDGKDISDKSIVVCKLCKSDLSTSLVPPLMKTTMWMSLSRMKLRILCGKTSTVMS